MHRRARPVDRRLIGADELGRERVFDTAVDMGDVYGGLPLPDQFRGVFHAADGLRGSVPAGDVVGGGFVVGCGWSSRHSRPPVVSRGSVRPSRREQGFG